ncbi:MAG: hypothetical protein HND59_11325 [Pseudomonadota bacterium]|nr:MAG: hypothetical protein HND59_11325 [Pseudomonadota bacterium]
MAEEMRSDTWSTEIKRLGFNWTVVNMDRWNDYSSTDVTISMRPLNERNLKNGSGFIFDADSKPSAKLTNSWLAGVPAIVGAEPAYQTIRRSALDYIEVRTPGETKEALQKLRRDKVLYKEMVDNGFERAKEYSVDSIKALWIESIDNEIINKYERWIGQSQAKRVLTAVGETISYFADIQNIKDILALIKK